MGAGLKLLAWFSALLVGGGEAAFAKPSLSWIGLGKRFHPGFKDKFDEYMEENVFGQHIASNLIPVSMRVHLEAIEMRQSGGPKRALALSLHGSTGTGKTYVSSFVEKALFGDEKAAHKYVFRGTSFQDPALVASYRKDIVKTTKYCLQRCPYHLFMFVDSHLIQPGVLDVLAPFLDYGSQSINGLDYSKAIYIFQTNECFREFNMHLIEHLSTGKMRSEIAGQPLQTTLDECLHSTSAVSPLLKQKQLVHHIPFLPLDRETVLQCATASLQQLRQRGRFFAKFKALYWSSEVPHYIANQMEMIGHFSVTGCKTVDDKVKLVEAVLNKVNRPNAKCNLALGIKNFMNQINAPFKKCYAYRETTLEISIVENEICVSLIGKNDCLNLEEVDVLEREESARKKAVEEQQQQGGVSGEPGGGKKARARDRSKRPKEMSTDASAERSESKSEL